MYFSEIYTIFFLDSFFHFLYLFKMWAIFMPHPVLPLYLTCLSSAISLNHIKGENRNYS